MCRHNTVIHSGRVDGRTVFVEPCNRVGAQNGREGGRVCRLARDGRDRWIPSRKLVVVLRGGSLGWVGMGRRLVVCHISRIDDGAVVVLPRNGVFIYRRVVGSRVRRLARDRCDLGRPARERVGVFRRRGLGRRCAAIGGRLAVEQCLGRKFRTVLVLPRHIVRAERGRVFGGVRRIGGNQLKFRLPARKVVIILRVGGPGR